MKHLLPLLREIELELRANKELSYTNLSKLSELSDWELKIIQDFMLRVNMAIQNNDINFVFKFFEKNTREIEKRTSFNQKIDILIIVLKRDQQDTPLTDVWNRLIVPAGLKHQTMEIWGMMVTRARNMAVEKALKIGARYLMFIDDDVVTPNNALMKLYATMEEQQALVTSGLYYKKVEPLEAPFENENGEIYIAKKDDTVASIYQYANKICGMGCCLLDIESITKEVPLPLFWEFGAPDGYWSMGEDAFFTQNLVEYTGKAPLVDTSIKCMHMDKTWKKLYGERDNEVVYASGIWDTNDIKSFERMRVPPEYPLVLIGIPTRLETDPIAADLQNLLLLRGYRSEFFHPHGLNVDDARNVIAQKALEMEADYLLFIDDDVVPPKDGLSRLLTNMEEIDEPCVISGNYCLKGNPPNSIHTQLNTKDGLVTDTDRTAIFNEGKLFECNWLIGLGFALIDTHILKQVRQPYFKCYAKGKDTDVNEDAHFTELCFEAGYKVYIDPTIECLHIDFNEKIIYGNEVKEFKNYAGFEDILNACQLYQEG